MCFNLTDHDWVQTRQVLILSFVQGRTPADLVRALRYLYVNDPMETGMPGCASFDWAGLGAETSFMFRTAPGVNNMLGPLHAEVRHCVQTERLVDAGVILNLCLHC